MHRKVNDGGEPILPKRVFLDGADVTNSCVEFDDERGYVVLLKRDGSGRVVYDGREAARERKEGRVEVRLP